MTQTPIIEIRASDGSLAGHVARVRYLPTLARRWGAGDGVDHLGVEGRADRLDGGQAAGGETAAIRARSAYS